MDVNELVGIIGDTMWPHDPWRDFNGNVRTAEKVARILIEKLHLDIPKRVEEKIYGK